MLAESATVERQTLADEKESLLRNIKDLEFEHEVGKISDADYQRLDASLRARARDVLRLLDEDLGPYRERAEVLIQKHLQKAVGSAPYRAPREPDTKVAERVCAKCGTTNDVDAKFCKECAHRFDADEPEAPTEEPDAKAATEEPETKKDEEASE
jgi:ribosomal protein L40E